jgi:hypothetical protein
MPNSEIITPVSRVGGSGRRFGNAHSRAVSLVTTNSHWHEYAPYHRYRRARASAQLVAQVSLQYEPRKVRGMSKEDKMRLAEQCYGSRLEAPAQKYLLSV